MVAYVIADVTIANPAGYENYKKLAAAAIAKHGGRYLVRGGPSEVLEGTWTPGRMVVLEFPSLEQARAFYTSVEYTQARRARAETARANFIVVEGV